MGPFDDVAEVAEVKDECESPFELVEDPMELTRGDNVPDEYANDPCSNGREGNLALAYGSRCSPTGLP